MKDKMYITTAIPYVNGAPHIGNALDYLIADAWARYQRQNGNEVRFQTGVDEHGNKVAAKALELGLTPQQYADQAHIHFKELLQKLTITTTDFVRTTDSNHMQAVQYIWQKLRPYIYKSAYEGWYCQGCEAFVTDKEAQENEGVCPIHGAPYQRLSEENYYLKTSVFADQIREAIETGKMRIVPEYRQNEFIDFLKNGFQDVSISRPKKNLSWGVPVPDDPNQVMYVWIDALANYITVLGYPDNQEWQHYWPADVEVIGKDILRFHAGIWPAMLLGLGLSLPKTLLVHGFVDSDGQKMSKSLGNVVNPNDIIDLYGAEAFRYYFLRHVPTLGDGDFTWEKFENVYNNELGNDLGNAVQRVASMLLQYQAGVIGNSPQTEHDTKDYHDAMRAFEFSGALDEIWVSVRALNQYIENVKPWEIAKNRKDDPEAEDHLSDVLGHCVGVLLQVGDLLKPFMPGTAQSIHDTFESGVVKEQAILFPRIYQHTENPRNKTEK